LLLLLLCSIPRRRRRSSGCNWWRWGARRWGVRSESGRLRVWLRLRLRLKAWNVAIVVPIAIILKASRSNRCSTLFLAKVQPLANSISERVDLFGHPAKELLPTFGDAAQPLVTVIRGDALLG